MCLGRDFLDCWSTFSRTQISLAWTQLNLEKHFSKVAFICNCSCRGFAVAKSDNVWLCCQVLIFLCCFPILILRIFMFVRFTFYFLPLIFHTSTVRVWIFFPPLCILIFVHWYRACSLCMLNTVGEVARKVRPGAFYCLYVKTAMSRRDSYGERTNYDNDMGWLYTCFSNR